FINPILVHLIALFDDQAEILVEESVPGRNVHVDGHFEFVNTRGGKKVCIVEAKKDDFDQGFTHGLLGCEAVADIESLSSVYGIVTNYLTWIFIRNLDDAVERD
ncbi:hypothetical protein EV426DRAFT_508789, partial [Tirmania nivea]